jgi:hypothetical protein
MLGLPGQVELLRRAWAAVLPEVIGTRSSTASGVVAMARPSGRGAGGGNGARWREPQVFAQRAARVVGTENPALLGADRGAGQVRLPVPR